MIIDWILAVAIFLVVVIMIDQFNNVQRIKRFKYHISIGFDDESYILAHSNNTDIEKVISMLLFAANDDMDKLGISEDKKIEIMSTVVKGDEK